MLKLLDRLPEAERVLEDVLQRQLATLGEDHAHVAPTRLALGDVRFRRGDRPGAVRLLESAYAAIDERHDAAVHGEAAWALARAIGREDVARAKELAKAAIEHYRRAGPAFEPACEEIDALQAAGDAPGRSPGR